MTHLSDYNFFNRLGEKRFHWVDCCSGNHTDAEKWLSAKTGTGMDLMVHNESGGGYGLTTGASANGAIRMYPNIFMINPKDCGCTFLYKVSSTTGGDCYIGMQSGTGAGGGDGVWTYPDAGWKGSSIKLYTKNDIGGNWVQTGVTSDTNRHRIKLECQNDLVASMHVDGVIEASSTTFLPQNKLQPMLQVQSSSTNRVLDIGYYEAWSI